MAYTACLLIDNSMFNSGLTIWSEGRTRFKLKDKTVVFIKKIDNNHLRVIYSNNGGVILEGIIDSNKLSKYKYFKELDVQFSDFNKLSIGEISAILSKKGAYEYRKCVLLISDSRKKKAEQDASDYKKLYKYWQSVCYKSENMRKESIGEQYIDVTYNYSKIKADKEKLHRELHKMFTLFNRR